MPLPEVATGHEDDPSRRRRARTLKERGREQQRCRARCSERRTAGPEDRQYAEEDRGRPDAPEALPSCHVAVSPTRAPALGLTRRIIEMKPATVPCRARS